MKAVPVGNATGVAIALLITAQIEVFLGALVLEVSY